MPTKPRPASQGTVSMTHVLAIPDTLAQRLQRIAESWVVSPPSDDWKHLALEELESFCDANEEDPDGESTEDGSLERQPS